MRRGDKAFPETEPEEDMANECDVVAEFSVPVTEFGDDFICLTLINDSLGCLLACKLVGALPLPSQIISLGS